MCLRACVYFHVIHLLPQEVRGLFTVCWRSSCYGFRLSKELPSHSVLSEATHPCSMYSQASAPLQQPERHCSLLWLHLFPEWVTVWITVNYTQLWNLKESGNGRKAAQVRVLEVAGWWLFMFFRYRRPKHYYRFLHCFYQVLDFKAWCTICSFRTYRNRRMAFCHLLAIFSVFCESDSIKRTHLICLTSLLYLCYSEVKGRDYFKICRFSTC